MSDVLLTIGKYQFSLDTAAHKDLQRTQSFRWASQARLTREPAMQYMGPGSVTINLSGSIFPSFRGGLGQIDDMIKEAKKGEPLTLADGQGNNHGRFCIKQISDTQQVFFGDGTPRKIDFQMQLEQYGEDAVPANRGGSGSNSGGSIFSGDNAVLVANLWGVATDVFDYLDKGTA